VLRLDQPLAQFPQSLRRVWVHGMRRDAGQGNRLGAEDAGQRGIIQQRDVIVR
jgi:hypothetical protein